MLSAIPFALWIGLAIKNFALVGELQAATWAQANPARATIHAIPFDDRRALEESGVISPTAQLSIMATWAEYERTLPPCSPTHPDVPALAEPTKGDGSTNRNYECLLPVYDEYGRSWLGALIHRPGQYAVAAGRGWQLFFMPPSLSPWTNESRAALGAYDRLWHVGELIVPLPLPDHVSGSEGLVDSDGRVELSMTYLVLFLVAIGLLVRSGRRVRRGVGGSSDRTQIAVSTTVVLVAVLTNQVDVGENYRFLLLVYPLLVLSGATAAKLWWTRRGRGSSSSLDASTSGERRKTGQRSGKPTTDSS
jgi:hypothetical protein